MAVALRVGNSITPALTKRAALLGYIFKRTLKNLELISLLAPVPYIWLFAYIVCTVPR